MYNIWCEVKKINIIFVIVGIIITIISYFFDSTIETISMLIITLAFISILLKSIFKYYSLKKNGVLLNNLTYRFENISDDEKVMIVEFEYQNNNYKLFKKQRTWNNIPDSGVTDVIINVKKSNEYFIFLPNK